MSRNRAYRRHKERSKMLRRVKEDRNQHYDDLNCPCYHDPKAIARFKEQPAFCSRACCGNPRHHFEGQDKYTLQERKAFASFLHSLDEI